MLPLFEKGRIVIVCEHCGTILREYNVSDAEFEKSKDVPLRISRPRCNVCSKVKSAWYKK